MKKTSVIAFGEGTICGHYIVLSDVSGPGTDRTQVRCTTCGVETSVRIYTLKELQNEVKRGGVTRGCKSCQPGGGQKSESQRYCPRCEGQSWRRPRVGICKCGESFREEEPLCYDFSASRGGIGSILAGGEFHP